MTSPATNGANYFLPPAIVIPGNLLITNISQAYPMAVSFTNSAVNTYVVGQLVRLFIPIAFGMQQANGMTGQIVTIDNVGFIFYLNIDSTNFDAFIPDTLIVVPGTPINVYFDNGFANIIIALGLPASIEIAPKTVNIGFASNFYTDPNGGGILVGNPAGSGTINYFTGDVQFASFPPGVFGGAVFALSYFPDSSTVVQPPSMSPAGSRNLTLGNNQNYVPFQNLSNTGN